MKYAFTRRYHSLTSMVNASWFLKEVPLNTRSSFESAKHPTYEYFSGGARVGEGVGAGVSTGALQFETVSCGNPMRHKDNLNISHSYSYMVLGIPDLKKRRIVVSGSASEARRRG